MATTARSRRRARPRSDAWRRVRAWVQTWLDLFARHNLLTYAGAIAFEMFVACVALALLGLGLLGVAGREDVWNQQIAPQLEKRFLPPVYHGIDATAQRIFTDRSAGLIAFAALLALWEVSRAVRASMTALTRIYEAEETRPAWLRFALSLAIAAATIVALLGAILVTIAWPGPSGGWHVPVAILRWAFALGLLALAFGLLVRLGPASSRDTRWISVGAILVVVGWVVQSLLFKWYVTSFANFRSASGSLVVFIFLTTYLAVAAVVLLVGIELDEQLRKDGADRRGPLAALHRVL